MQKLKDLKRKDGNVLLESVQQKIIKEFKCDQCDEEVKRTEYVIPFGPKKGETVMNDVGCKCADKAMAKQRIEEAHKKQVSENLLRKFSTYSLINESLESATFEDFQISNDVLDKAKKTAEQYAVDFPNVGNLLFSGTYGTGKSHLSVSITKELIKQGKTCIFISFPKLITKIKDTFNDDSATEDQIIRLMKQVDLLVIDDIGAEHCTPWTTSKLFEIIDDRSGRPTVFTTNLNAKSLKDWVGERIFSRMMNNTTAIKMECDDYRRKQF